MPIEPRAAQYQASSGMLSVMRKKLCYASAVGCSLWAMSSVSFMSSRRHPSDSVSRWCRLTHRLCHRPGRGRSRRRLAFGGTPASATLALDLIILDLRFRHDRDGVDFLEQLKGDPQTLPIPVFVCSADHHRLQQERGQLTAWDCGVLAKPFGLEDLLTAICLRAEPPDVDE